LSRSCLLALPQANQGPKETRGQRDHAAAGGLRRLGRAALSRTYLDGEERQGAFTGWLCMTLGAVLLLVQAGNLLHLVLAWIATSVFLHKLLLFYPDRVEAQRAARKNG
jgi:hypothetical protein